MRTCIMKNLASNELVRYSNSKVVANRVLQDTLSAALKMRQVEVLSGRSGEGRIEQNENNTAQST